MRSGIGADFWAGKACQHLDQASALLARSDAETAIRS
jgi:hypothetical protein